MKITEIPNWKKQISFIYKINNNVQLLTKTIEIIKWNNEQILFI